MLNLYQYVHKCLKFTLVQENVIYLQVPLFLKSQLNLEVLFEPSLLHYVITQSGNNLWEIVKMKLNSQASQQQ